MRHLVFFSTTFFAYVGPLFCHFVVVDLVEILDSLFIPDLTVIFRVILETGIVVLLLKYYRRNTFT
jgi:positive regulator of sigma E activity